MVSLGRLARFLILIGNAIVTCACHAQLSDLSVDELLSVLDQRDQRFSNKQFIWRVLHTVRSEPSPAASGPNMPPAAVQKKAIHATLRYEVVVTRLSDAIVVQGKGVVLNLREGTASLDPYVAFFGKGWSGELVHDGQKLNSLQVTASGANSWKHVNAARVVYDLHPEHFIFLCGTSPRDLHGLRWAISQRNSEVTVLQAYPRKEAPGDNWLISSIEDLQRFGLDPNVLFEMEVLNSWLVRSLRFNNGFEELPANLPSDPNEAIKVVLKSPRSLEHEIRVLKTRTINGYEFPQTVIERRYGASKHELIWQLVEVRDAPATANIWSETIPDGITVFDFRHCGAGYNMKPPGCTPVAYEWKGSLLSIEELKRRAASSPRTPSRNFGWVIWIPPVVLILLGTYWLWRLRVSRGSS